MCNHGNSGLHILKKLIDRKIRYLKRIDILEKLLDGRSADKHAVELFVLQAPGHRQLRERAPQTLSQLRQLSQPGLLFPAVLCACFVFQPRVTLGKA